MGRSSQATRAKVTGAGRAIAQANAALRRPLLPAAIIAARFKTMTIRHLVRNLEYLQPDLAILDDDAGLHLITDLHCTADTIRSCLDVKTLVSDVA
jgi:hypothetical protein